MKKYMFSFLLLGIFSFGFTRANERAAMHPNKQIKFVKEQIRKKAQPYYEAYVQLLSKSDSLLNVSEHALSDFVVPGFYINKETHRRNSLSLSQDAFSAYALALAYRLSDNKEYGKKACYFLNAWGKKNKKYSDQ